MVRRPVALVGRVPVVVLIEFGLARKLLAYYETRLAGADHGNVDV